MSEENPTLNPTPDGNPPTGDGDGKDQDGKPDDAVDYKTRYAESTRENQRILDENKSLKSDLEKNKSNYSDLEKSFNELDGKFKDENPESYDAVKANKTIGDLQGKVAGLSEDNKLNDYVQSNSNANKHKGALRDLGRANPNKSYETLWEENFAGFYKEAGKKTEKKSQPESGEGAVTPDMETGEMPKDFNTWPMAKREAWFRGKGIKH